MLCHNFKLVCTPDSCLGGKKPVSSCFLIFCFCESSVWQLRLQTKPRLFSAALRVTSRFSPWYKYSERTVTVLCCLVWRSPPVARAPTGRVACDGRLCGTDTPNSWAMTSSADNWWGRAAGQWEEPGRLLQLAAVSSSVWGVTWQLAQRGCWTSSPFLQTTSSALPKAVCTAMKRRHYSVPQTELHQCDQALENRTCKLPSLPASAANERREKSTFLVTIWS